FEMQFLSGLNSGMKNFPTATKNYGSKSAGKSATVIIGAGFGDEGKGLLTDFHAAPFGANCIVARFNGGAQAGHTVVLPDGRGRHVFSHFGSGTLTGAATFLSKHFVSNPLLFSREKIELAKFGVATTGERTAVFADERGLVTTPYDMLANQFVETARGAGKHGSCGIGFGETIERSLNERFRIQICDLADAAQLRTRLDDIRQNWTPARLNKLNVLKLNGEQMDLLASNKLRDDFIEAAGEFYEGIRLARPEILTRGAKIVFEGAQGLLLDQDYGWFPHVTRSHTGLKNAVETALEAGIKQLDCVYATRAYATRHGAGPLPHELPDKPFADIKDATNIANPHQDRLRFGWLDLDSLGRAIRHDIERYSPRANFKITKQLAITCLDQLDARTSFVRRGKLCEATADDFTIAAARAVNVNEVFLSRGQTRETITKMTLSRNVIATKAKRVKEPVCQN
ncbi:MAG: adenylosuccinate synthetase, partial [Pyrinomonadaceae bacterium]